jgi:hypothetical protein
MCMRNLEFLSTPRSRQLLVAFDPFHQRIANNGPQSDRGIGHVGLHGPNCRRGRDTRKHGKTRAYPLILRGKFGGLTWYEPAPALFSLLDKNWVAGPGVEEWHS